MSRHGFLINDFYSKYYNYQNRLISEDIANLGVREREGPGEEKHPARSTVKSTKTSVHRKDRAWTVRNTNQPQRNK